MRSDRRRAARAGRVGAAAIAAAVLAATHAARAADAGEAVRGAGDGDGAVMRLLRTAEDLLLAREHERGIEMLKKIVQQHPASPVRFRAFLALGKHYLDVRKEAEAVGYLAQVKGIERPGAELAGDDLDLYLEALYLTGVANFRMRQYQAAFPPLRKIATNHPNTVWANQAFYYIGMCHFAQENWNKAIEALSLVGTFIDPDGPAVEFAEAGRRLYVKIADADLPVLKRLGEKVTVELATDAGDSETVECIPLSGEGDVYIGSVAGAVGPPRPGDGTLQVVGGDAVSVTYQDGNTKEGERNVPRGAKVRVVSTASLGFVLGDFDAPAEAAFLGTPQFLLLSDVDLDTTPGRETAEVAVVSRYREREAKGDAPGAGFDMERLLRGEESEWRIRDEVRLVLEERQGRSGRFGGRVPVEAVRRDSPPDRGDGVLTCALDDEIVASYTDALHAGGDVPREVTARVRVVGELESRPMATQYVVYDPVVKAKKSLVEGTAYLELGRIFSSMGLKKGAAVKCDSGLELVESVIRSQEQVPSTLREEAFKLKWELETVKRDFAAAIATCQVFSRLFPTSPFVDQALMGIGRIKLEEGLFGEAIDVFRRVLELRTSQAKAEAQFRIAETVERQAEEDAAKRGSAQADGSAAAMPHYKLCAERYPESEFAGPSLAKLVDYYIGTKDYAQADDLLEQIFQDYPDAQFLDQMLLKWVLVSYNRGNLAKARDKCMQLLFEYPASPFAEKAKALLPRVERRMGK